MTTNEQLVMEMAFTLLLLQPQLPRTSETIGQAVQQCAAAYPDIDTTMIVRELESRFSVTYLGEIQILQDRRHIAWLPEKRSAVEWRFWKRYERWLQVKRMPEAAIHGIDEFTDIILGLLEDPKRQGTWDRRGLVVGNVQSGKTANYAGVINKAIDAGYKVIIVLAGMHNSLRSQTQLRLDHDVIGYDSQKTRVGDEILPGIGVGTIDRRCIAHSLTDSTEHGDFSRARANVNFTPGGDPVVLVVKKNGPVLRHILRWLRSYGTQMEGNRHHRVLNDIPLLLIDDEADNASADTNAAERDARGNPLEDNTPSAINGLIRQILCCFEKRAYVGYTATPFANLFIYPTDNATVDNAFGGDLFPESFIINLPPSSDYIGPVQVFGLDDDVRSGISAQEGLPIVRVVDDYAAMIPPGHKKELHVPGLPPSLQEAIKAFLLCCAMRRARGQTGVHNSMLIHITRFTAVQHQVMSLIKDDVHALRRRIRYGDGNLPVSILDELRVLWEQDFVPNTARIIELVDDPAIITLTWDDIAPHLLPVVEAIEFKLVNGSAKDALDYYDHPNGMTVIAVGGDKLSRGLTLEGLSVSYYLRASSMYDTLLQMGRWFGYRHGYLDGCRLYTSGELLDWYRYITLAYEELRREFDEMVSRGGTPLDYRLKVRSHPAGLQITAANKLRNSQRLQVTFDSDIVETFAFHKNPDVVANNYHAVESWLASIGQHSATKQNNYLWEGVPGHRIVELLEGLTFHPHVRKAASGLLTPFISRQFDNGKLTSWTVALISNQGGVSHQIANRKVGLTDRSDISPDGEKYAVSRNHLISRADEALDLSQQQFDRALQVTNQQRIDHNLPGDADFPSPKALRQVRAEENGLLLIYPLNPAKVETVPPLQTPVMGIALSFPCIERAIPIEYDVSTFYQQLFGDEDDL